MNILVCSDQPHTATDKSQEGGRVSRMETNYPSLLARTKHKAKKRAVNRLSDDLFPGPAIPGHQIRQNEKYHVILIDQLIVRGTPDEYHLLLRLMERYDQPLSYRELIAQFHDASSNDLALLKAARAKLTYMLSALRTKIWSSDFAIVRVVDVGYMLIDRNKLWSTAHTVPDEKP